MSLDRLKNSPPLRDLACFFFLTIATVLFFSPLLQGYWLPRGGGDLVSLLWPLYRFAARSLRAGVIPLWNPYLYSGAPFLADNQSALFYPINLIAFALFGEPSYQVMEGLVVLHILLAALNAFVLARGLGLRRSAALLGGIAFAFSDLFVTHIGNLNINATAAWLPLFLLLAHRALSRAGFGWALGAGAIFAVAALAGHAQILFFFALTLGLYLAYRLVRERRCGLHRLFHLVGLSLVILIVGIGGAALSLLPAYELTAHTARSRLPYEEATRYSLPPRALLGLVAPDFYGRGLDRFWGPWERVEVGYVGVGVLALAFVGVGIWLGKRPVNPEPEESERFPVGFFLLLAGCALLLALGRYTPLYRLLCHLPVFGQLRVPARFVLLFDLSLAMLAGLGFDRLLAGRARRAALLARLVALIGIALLFTVGMRQARAVPVERVPQATASILKAAGWLMISGLLIPLVRQSRWAGWAMVLLVAGELVSSGWRLEIEAHDPTLGFNHEDVVAFLRHDPSPFRIEGVASAWQPNAALVHRLYDIGGLYHPLELDWYRAYLWSVGERGGPLYNLLGAKYVLADKGSPPGDARLVPVYTDNPQLDVYLNTAALPRALLIYRARVLPAELAFEAIHRPEFDPTQEVVLEKGEALEADPGQGERYVHLRRYEPNRVELAVRTPAAAYLLLTDIWYPGWRAKVDGHPAELVRADYAFRAVLVPPGEHLVVMEFAPWSWPVGLAASIATWTGLSVWLLAQIRRRCHVRSPGPLRII